MDYNKKYLKYKMKYLELKKKENMLQLGGGDQNKPTVYLFKADWCPHCKSFAPVWDQIENELKGKANFVKYDADKNAKEVKNYGVDGFPTIIMTAGGKAVEFAGERSKENVLDFIKQYL
jgi:thioredoxin 1